MRHDPVGRYNTNVPAPAKSVVEAVLAHVTSAGISIVSLLTGLLAATLILYSGYVLYDTFYTSNQAFASNWDLLQYKPEIIEDDQTPLAGTLSSITEDYRGWLTLYDTNIDYPVFQGDDDLFYANHDYHGNASLTGEIYMAAASDPDFADSYNLLYGHHMDNGAMFGALDSYADPASGQAYFDAHREGVLITDGKVFDLKVFAVVNTNAYESRFYSVSGRSAAQTIGFIEDAMNGVDTTTTFILDEEEAGRADKIVAFSTCADATTYGRLVVVASMTERNMTPAVPASTSANSRDDGPYGPNDPPVDAPADPGSDIPGGDDNDGDVDTPNDGGDADDDATDEVSDDLMPQGSFMGRLDGSDDLNDFENGGDNNGGITGGPEDIEDVETPLAHFINYFKPTGSSYGSHVWALVNLICLIVTVYLFLPLLSLRAKYGRGRRMRKFNEEKEGLLNAQDLDEVQQKERLNIISRVLADRSSRSSGKAETGPVTAEEFGAAVEEIYYHITKFSRRFTLGTFLELLLSVGAIAAFILTENIRLPMVLIDKWTPLMIVILALCWLADVTLAGYRDKMEDGEEEPQLPNGIIPA